MLSFQMAGSESQAAWEKVLNDLAAWGLVGEKLRLMATNGGSGLIAAVEALRAFKD